MAIDFTVPDITPATPQQIYDTWLDSRGHEQMTGGGPARQSTKIGAETMAWNNYITGRNLTLVPGARIVQSWRTTRFTPREADSEIEVMLEPASGGGTIVSVRHSNVPDGHTSYRDGGWQRSYFEPMKRYFAARR